MRARFTDSMNVLHTWAGLLVGWVLFAIFLSGSLAYFQHEISHWMQPDLPKAAPEFTAVAQAEQYLQQHANASKRWTVVLPGERGLTTELFWQPAPTRQTQAPSRRFERVSLAGDGQPAQSRDSRGGQFFYRFHFDLHYMPVLWARWIVGVSSMFMLLALITGVIIHKKIFKDFFSLQWHKGHKSWLDAHTLSSVLALPFHLMITYTGLVTLMFLYMGSLLQLNFSSTDDFFSALDGRVPVVQATGRPAAMQSLPLLVADASRRWQGAPIGTIAVLNPGDAAAVVEINEAETTSLTGGGRQLRYAGATGELLASRDALPLPEHVRQTLINLHAGRFADPLLRWLYFASGLLGTAMIASGLLLWTARRLRPGNHLAPTAGQQWVHLLNSATILGMPLAVAGYFWANRLLPTTLANRAECEIAVFFAVWALVLGWALCLMLKRSWQQQQHKVVLALPALWANDLICLAAAFGLLPLFDLLTSHSHLWSHWLAKDWPRFAVDLSLLLSALLCLQSARVLRRKQQQPSPDATTTRQVGIAETP